MSNAEKKKEALKAFKKQASEYFKNDAKRMQELAAKTGGKITPVFAIDKENAAKIEQLKALAKSLDVKVEVQEPLVEGVSYVIEKAVGMEGHNTSYGGPSICTYSRPEPEKKLTRLQKTVAWFGRRFAFVLNRLPKKRKKWKKGEGVQNLEGLCDNLDTRAAKHEMNAILRLAEVDAAFTLSPFQAWTERQKARKNRLKKVFSDFWGVLRGN